MIVSFLAEWMSVKHEGIWGVWTIFHWKRSRSSQHFGSAESIRKGRLTVAYFCNCSLSFIFLCHWYKGEVKCLVSDLFIFFSQESSIQLSGMICFFSLAFLFKGSLFTVLNKYVGWTSGWTWAMSVPGWPRRPSCPSLHQKRCCQQ